MDDCSFTTPQGRGARLSGTGDHRHSARHGVNCRGRRYRPHHRHAVGERGDHTHYLFDHRGWRPVSGDCRQPAQHQRQPLWHRRRQDRYHPGDRLPEQDTDRRYYGDIDLMPVLRVQDFSAIVPVKGDRAIPDGFATASYNTWLYGSELRGVRPPLDLIACQSTTRRVLRIPKRTSGGAPAYPGVVPPPSYLGDSVWVQFTDHNTDVIKGQLIEDQY